MGPSVLHARLLAAQLAGLVIAGTGCSASHVLPVADASPAPEDASHDADATACPRPRLLCDGVCVDVASDDANCGVCGLVCTDGWRCAHGDCAPVGSGCPRPLVACGTDCVDLLTDAAHCSACAVRCTGSDVCVGGTCTTPVVPCVLPELVCDAVCVDIATDEAHCGRCDHACPFGARCEVGACAGACLDGRPVCGDRCSDPLTDRENCGSCGVVCPTGTRCSAGVCETASFDWPTTGGNVARSGLNAGEGGRPPLTREWSVEAVEYRELRPVAIVAGRVFVASGASFAGNEIIAYDLSDGARLWSFDLGEAFSIGQPTVADGVVYVARNKGTATTVTTDMVALDASTGALLWRTGFGSQWENFWAPLVVGDAVFANGGTGGGLYAWDRFTGTQRFFSGVLPQCSEWSPAWDGDHVLTFIDTTLRLHDPLTGVVDRTTIVPGDWHSYRMQSMPAVDGGRTFVISPPTLHAIDTASGAVLWSSGDDLYGAPAAAEGDVYTVSSSGLQARDAATGALSWSFVGDAYLRSPAVLTNQYVYVSTDERVYALERETGTLVWSADVGGWLSIGEGHLLVASATGTLTAFALSAGP